MDDYFVPTDEQETVIQFDRSGATCHVYTTDSTMMTKLDKIHERVKQDYVNGKPIAAYYEFDKGLLSFRSKRVNRKPLTDKQKETLKKNLEKANKMR